MAGQMDLFKGKRQRGVKPPSPLEFPVHCAIADTLKRWIMPQWFWFHSPNGEERPSKVDEYGKRYSPAAERLQRMGARNGVSDFLLFGPPWATIHAYELKRRGHKPTDEQLRFGEDVVKAGGFFAWGDSYEHAIEQFQVWGAVSRVVRPQ